MCRLSAAIMSAGTAPATGRPKGEEIPIGARILAVVDCFDALASDRQYRKALPVDQALGVVRRAAGKDFDPAVVELLHRVMSS